MPPPQEPRGVRRLHLSGEEHLAEEDSRTALELVAVVAVVSRHLFLGNLDPRIHPLLQGAVQGALECLGVGEGPEGLGRRARVPRGDVVEHENSGHQSVPHAALDPRVFRGPRLVVGQGGGEIALRQGESSNHGHRIGVLL